MLVAKKDDLDHKRQMVLRSRLQIENMISSATAQIKKLQESAAKKTLQKHIDELEAQDRRLQTEEKQLNNERSVVQKELDTVSRIISKHIQTQYTLCGSG
jgi:uncharacterized protein YlxW (UPF0749 family)